jgi:propanol-preferring alcohol dehydrogenase
MKVGLFPDIQYPRVPGHKVAGVVESVGEDVKEWKILFFLDNVSEK